MQTFSLQRLGKHVLGETNTHTTEERCFRCGPRRGVILKTINLTSSVEWSEENYLVGEWESSVEGWQLSWALQERLRRDGAIVEFTVDNSSVAGYSHDSNQVRAGSWRTFTVRNRCCGTAVEDTAGWKILSGCCGDLWIVESSDIAVITCSSEWCAQVVNRSNIQSIPRLWSHSWIVTIGWLMNNELEMIFKEAVLAQPWYYPGVCLEGPRKTMEVFPW
jgi:hypothetical protein